MNTELTELTYRGVISHGSIVLEDNPQLPEGTVVEVRPVVPSTLSLAGHEACGIWADRTDLQDSSAFARSLRRQVESRPY